MNIFKLMFHVVISDTHSPQCIDKSYEHTKKILNKYPFVDTIVLNGDILTSTAMTSSNLHRNGLTNNDKEEYLKAGSPIFYGKWKKTKKITYEMVFEYINERYDWLYQVIENFAKLKRTIFNLGNHESEHQLLIFGELSMLTNSQKDDIPIVDTIAVKEIVKKFEKKLLKLEKKTEFHYVRNKHVKIDDTLILGIPGISHATTGFDPSAKAQEEQTKYLLSRLPNLQNTSKIIIYNHTLGEYDKTTGKFDCASQVLKQFMNTLPSNIKTKIFVQSHNHWSYTQFMKHSDFHYVINNAGLHNGCFNLIEFSNDVSVYDVDPSYDKVTKLKLHSNFNNQTENKDLIARYYDDVEFIMCRMNNLPYVEKPVDVNSVKKSVFGIS